jgi:hypothetical protein
MGEFPAGSAASFTIMLFRYLLAPIGLCRLFRLREDRLALRSVLRASQLEKE